MLNILQTEMSQTETKKFKKLLYDELLLEKITKFKLRFCIKWIITSDIYE